MLATQNDSATCSGLMERISDARRRSDELFGLLRVEALYDRPIPERHRIIFYVGHLEAFDWNLLHETVLGLKSHHPEFDRLFAFGIDPVGGGLPSDQPSDWPSLDAVRNYVADLRATLDEQLGKRILELENQASQSHARGEFSLDTLLNVAIEHRLMHVETLSYMFHQLPFDRKVRPERVRDEEDYEKQENEQTLRSIPVVPRMVEVPAGSATLGLARSSVIFGWDNEYEAQTVHVPAFNIDQYKVTNGEYLKFMAAGGYDTRSFWTDEDWNWRTANAISQPVFWKKVDGGHWLYRTMFDEVPFDEVPLTLDWPVYVSHAEASAYARWAGKSLPTEAEWHRAAYGAVNGREKTYPWGNAPPSSFGEARLGNFDFYSWDPTPVNAFPEGESEFGVDDMLGNGWEWTSSIFAPFPGFEPFPFYPGYSANFFDGKHFVLKGGSARTAACMLRSTFRNWFQAHYQYVYAGFRCVSR
jgi:gamma-glutamyl hercynylcysteine S-oxide synthase